MSVNYKSIPSPCYVLDEGLLRKNLSLIKHVAQSADVEIILAFKGFAFWSVFPIVREYINSATASSLHEAQLAFEEMKSPAHTYAPAYTDEDFDEIVKYSSHITFNSLTQFEHFFPRLQTIGKHVSAGLRINHEFSEVGTELYNPCSPGSRLGITVDKLGDKLPEGVEGLHFHSLCESDSYMLEKTLDVVIEKFGKYFNQIKWLNMGGGHLITRKGYDIDHLIALLRRFKETYGLQIILEPGSAFGWETGVLVSRILDIIDNKGVRTAILDVSFTAHMPDCLEMPYKPRIVGAVEPSAGTFSYRMGGNSCLAGDWIGDWAFDHELRIGETIVFEDMIHYTMVKTNFFNGIRHPSIGTWNDEQGFKLVRSFSYLDYRNKLS